MLFSLVPRTLRVVAAAGLAATVLACGGARASAHASGTVGLASVRAAAPLRATRDLLRLDATTGGGVDVTLHRADSTLALALRVPSDTVPRAATRVRVAADAARTWADSATRLADRAMESGQEVRVRVTGAPDESPLELIRIAGSGVADAFWLLSLADSTAVELGASEARDFVRMLRLAAVLLAPTPEEEAKGLRVYAEDQVERPVLWATQSCMPRYPEELRREGITGFVHVQFVVNTSGRPDPDTFRVLEQTDGQFATAIASALHCMRFEPARAHGRTVRQVIVAPFNFEILRK